MNPIKEKCVVHFKLCVDFKGCDYSKGNGRATSEVMMQQEVKCMPNNQYKFTMSNEK